MKTNLIGLPSGTYNYLLCIMWKDSSNNVFRYKLWEDVGETVAFDIAIYAGQKIGKNFRLEIWSLDGEPTAVQDIPFNLLTSVLQGLDYRYSLDASIGNNDGIVTNLSARNFTTNVFPANVNLIAHWETDFGFTPAIWTSNDANSNRITPLGMPSMTLITDNSVATNQVIDIEGINYAAIFPAGNYTVRHIFFLVKFKAPAIGNTNVYSMSGPGGMKLQVDPLDDNNVTLTLEDGVTTTTCPINRWVVIEVAYNDQALVLTVVSAIHVYDIYNQDPALVYPTGFVVNTTDTTQVPGFLFSGFANPIPYNLAEILCYTTYVGATNIQPILDYFYGKYNFIFALPLTFPSNSSPQPNT